MLKLEVLTLHSLNSTCLVINPTEEKKNKMTCCLPRGEVKLPQRESFKHRALASLFSFHHLFGYLVHRHPQHILFKCTLHLPQRRVIEITIQDQSKAQFINRPRLKKKAKMFLRCFLFIAARSGRTFPGRLCAVLGSGSQGEFQAEATQKVRQGQTCLTAGPC